MGRRTPSITSRWSGSSRSLEDVEDQHHNQHSQHPRSRQLSATQCPPTQPQYSVCPTSQQFTGYPTIQQHSGSRSSLQSPPLYSTTSGQSPVNLEENKGMTSSTEELSTTLVSSYHYKQQQQQQQQATTATKHTAEPVSKQPVWVPIDVPNRPVISPTVNIERPEPTRSNNSKTKLSKPKQAAAERLDKKDKDIVEPTENIAEPIFSWSNIASGSCKTQTPEPLTLSLNKKLLPSSRTLPVAPVSNTGTSDDDGCSVADIKKERKKKKRRSKNGGDGASSSETISSSVSVNKKSSADKVKSKPSHTVPETDFVVEDCVAEQGIVDTTVSEITPLDIDLDHFEASPDSEPATLPVTLCLDENEFPSDGGACDTFRKDHLYSSQDDACDTDGNYSAARVDVVDNLDDFELQEEEDAQNGNDGQGLNNVVLLSSVHSDNDLAKALEEACSDDDNGRRQASVSTVAPSNTNTRNQRVSEMFPYRVSSSDDDEEKPWVADGSTTVRARCTDDDDRVTKSIDVVVESSVVGCGVGSSSIDDMSTDDRGETTSGDDRRGSDSSVNTTQPKSKKKKKKRR